MAVPAKVEVTVHVWERPGGPRVMIIESGRQRERQVARDLETYLAMLGFHPVSPPGVATRCRHPRRSRRWHE